MTGGSNSLKDPSSGLDTKAGSVLPGHDRDNSTSTTSTATPSNSPLDASQAPSPTPDETTNSQPIAPTINKSRSKKKQKVVLQDQSSPELSTLTKVVIFCGLGLSLFLSFLDSTSVATAAPIIAKELDAGETISWVGTSYLVAKWVVVCLFYVSHTHFLESRFSGWGWMVRRSE